MVFTAPRDFADGAGGEPLPMAAPASAALSPVGDEVSTATADQPADAEAPAASASAGALAPARENRMILVRKNVASQPRRFYAGPIFAGASPIAVADVRYLLTVHPPADPSAEARAQALADIQRAVSAYAVAHDLSLVLDSSGQGLEGVYLVLTADQTLDITADIRQNLQNLVR